MSRFAFRSLFVFAIAFAAAAASARPAAKGLSRGEAERRAALVKSPEYDLTLTLDGDESDFTGHEVLRFTLDSPSGDLTVDFSGGAIIRLLVNGAPVAAPKYAGLFIELPKIFLRAGENVVIVDYTHPYGADGVGLHRFKDPEDGRTYLYSNFEPYDANKMFPCFDQPDLKATYRLTVNAPSDWTVVSAAMEEKTATSGARRVWVFAVTPKMSSYVFSVHAGPYRVWTSTAGAIPLRLLARESLAKHVRFKEWFEVTRQGLGFYGDYFALPYPFKKYDQLIVPDFAPDSAMENAGAVTFSESFVFRSSPTIEDRENLAGTILHEMAHMWFGDLVTMKWWNGLWLNESFATYTASLSAGRVTRFRRSGLTFFSNEKLWAYDTDQLETTHPIEGDVTDTEQAFANFDGITYGKGASVLKQLAHFIGPEKFRDGVRLYLKTHSYGNAEERDFFGAMSARSPGVDLGAWVKEWLETTGVNTVRADCVCEKGRISSFALLQTSDNGHLRSHRTVVALYEAGKGGTLKAGEYVSVAYSGARTEVPALVGRPCPELIYPNHDDQDYVKVELDPRSLAAAKVGLLKIEDPLARMMLWRALWEMVLEAKWPATEYADLVVAVLGAEADFKVASSVLATVRGKREYSPSVLNYLPHPDYPRLEAFFWKNALMSEPGGDFQKLWFDGFVEIAASEAGAARLRGLLNGETAVQGMPIDQDRRWRIIARLSELGVSDAEFLIVAEAGRDPSDQGIKSAITARAAKPDLASKRAWFDTIAVAESKASLGEQRAAMASFRPRTQLELRGRFVEPFFKTLADLASKDGDFLDEYMHAMYPALCTPDGAARLARFLAEYPPSNPIILRALRDARQEEERCVKIRGLLKCGLSGGPTCPRSPTPATAPLAPP